MLEGWAIVDNTTGEDWTKVQLSLVSGRPISFVSQLYAPKYINRPSAELADDPAAQAGGPLGRVRRAGQEGSRRVRGRRQRWRTGRMQAQGDGRGGAHDGA